MPASCKTNAERTDKEFQIALYVYETQLLLLLDY